MPNLTSSLPRLSPVMVIDPQTGIIIEEETWKNSITALTRYVLESVKNTWDNQKQRIIEDVEEYEGLSPAEFGRQKGYKLVNPPPENVKARSRVEKLYQHKLITGVSSYVRNTTKNKQEPSFSGTLNLGAVDKQMVSLSYDDNTQEMSLLWKCWEREYLFLFKAPDYVSSRKIHKWNLPSITVNDEGEISFYYSYTEKMSYRSYKSSSQAGLDLGRVEPYTIVVTNKKGKRQAHYTTSGRLKTLAHKREKLIIERGHVLRKAHHYDSLGLCSDTLKREAGFLLSKIKGIGKTLSWQLASEISRKLKKHELNILQVENLSWAHGKKYGSRWTHSHQQEALTHSLIREGIRVKKVNPKNTSTTCSHCGSLNMVNKKRKKLCVDCRSSFDRDYNAALNIARKNTKYTYPNAKRILGDNCSLLGQVIRRSNTPIRAFSEKLPLPQKQE